MRLPGQPLHLAEYGARTLTNRRFVDLGLGGFDRYFLPPAMTGLTDEPPLGLREFIEDDNRGAIAPEPVATLDGTPFYLSVKGIGSATEPFSTRPLERSTIAGLTRAEGVRERLATPRVANSSGEADRFITGEVWLRGSPYGGQGMGHAEIALRLSERADPTSIAGFRIAPVVKVAYLPEELADRIRSLHWYRAFRGPIVQELRLVPSNVRIAVHSRTTVADDARHLFDRFELADDRRSLDFETRFLRTSVALLTLFARTMAPGPTPDRVTGLDLLDVGPDKDAVVAPSGEIFFVDLEGVEPVAVDRPAVVEKIEDQMYRSLADLLFALEQIEGERRRRFGEGGSRKAWLAALLARALDPDPIARVVRTGDGLDLEIRNALADQSLYTTFRLLDP